MSALRTTTARATTGVAATALALAAFAVAPAHAAGTANASPTNATQVQAPAAKAAKTQRVFKVRTEKQLRNAVRKANKSKGKDRIVLLRSIRFAKGRGAQGGAGRGDLDVRGSLVVMGRGKTINARGVDRVFDVRGDSRLVVKRLYLRNGAPAETESGGLVRSRGEVEIRKSHLLGSEVTGEGASGGAVMNDGGMLRIVDSRVRGNSAERAGGGIEALGGTTVVVRSRLTGNDTGAVPGNGGAVHLAGHAHEFGLDVGLDAAAVADRHAVLG